MDLENCQVITKKNIPKKCEHNRRKTRCKDCSGGSICEHEKEFSRCRNCNGSFCKHKY